MATNTNLNYKYDEYRKKIDAVDFYVRYFSDFDIDQFELAKDAYYGSGGFYTGEYLEKAPREDEKKYAYRVANKKYSNFVRPTVNGLIDPVLYRDPIRTSPSQDEYFTAFEDAPTLSTHTTLTQFVHQSGVNGFLYGGIFTACDNFPSEMIPSDKATALEKRVFPYVYNITPQEVSYYSFDRFGRLRYLSYCVEEGAEQNTYRVYRLADEQDLELGYTGEIGDAITYTTIDGEPRNPNTVVQAYSMPYFMQISPQFDKRIFPVSVIQPLADASRNIFQINSLIHYQHTQLTFPILTYNGQKSEEMTLSEDSVLFYDEGTNRPDYIAPPRDTLEALYKDRENTKYEVYEMTHQAVNTVSAQASGEARKQADKQRQEVLSFVEKRLIEYEKWILDAFFWYLDDESDVNIVYQSNLDGADFLLDIEELGDLIERVGISEEAKTRLTIKLLRKKFVELTDEEFKSQIARFEENGRTFGDEPLEDEDSPEDELEQRRREA